jgi:hypothetical protein
MELCRRKIILTGKRLMIQDLTLDHSHSLENEYIFLDPLSLYDKIDWTNWNDEVSVLNYIYEKLFDNFLMENKTLVCYWPIIDFTDCQWFNLLEFAKKASIRIDLNYFNEERNAQDETSLELQTIWKELVLELIESISQDIIFNEELVEIGQLKNDQLSITIFSQNKGEKLSYFYVTSAQEIFEFEPQYEFEKDEKSTYVPIFTDFEGLLGSLQKEFDLVSYAVKFFDSKLEHVYFKALIKENMNVNLIQNWIDFSSLN